MSVSAEAVRGGCIRVQLPHDPVTTPACPVEQGRMGPLGLVCVCTSRTRGQGMSIYRHKLWTDVAALDDHLTVFLKLDEALENFLGDFGFSSPEPYKISTGGGAVDRPSRAQISAAVDTLGGSLHSL